MSNMQRQTRQVGDTLTAIAATLTRPDGTVVDVSALTTKFAMYEKDGTIVVTETTDNVTETDAAAGEVQYDPQAADVDTPGTYYAYFIAESGGGAQDTFPVVTGELEIEIVGVGHP